MSNSHRASPPAAKRLAWQCRRGMRELDLLLGHFLDHHYSGLSQVDQSRFVALLDYPDPLLLEYLMGRMVPTDVGLADIVHQIRAASTS